MNGTINHENKEKNKLKKLDFTKKDYLSFTQFCVKWVKGGDKLEIYDYLF